MCSPRHLRVTLASFLALGLSSAASAQERSRHADVWTFGDFCRMTWNDDASSFTFTNQAAIATDEGCASFSDPATGELLIYTDGITVWDPAAGNPLTGGAPVITDLPGDPSSLHSGVIVPVPGSPGQVYVFGHSWGHSTTIAYRAFDVTNGVTPIGSSNTEVALGGTGAEGMLVVPHTNGVDYWLVVSGATQIFVLPITSSGVGAPVATPSGVSVWSNGWHAFAMSHQGDKLIISGNEAGSTIGAFGDMYAFDFDRATGTFSNQTLLNAGFRRTQFYGGVFSPNGRFFYFSTLTEGATDSAFYQYGLDSGEFIELSRVGTPYTHGDGRLGPDGVIYVAGDRARALHTITNPDVACTANACGFTYGAIPQPQGCTIYLGLPQTPSPIVDVQLDLSVNILTPAGVVTATSVTPAGSANAPNGATVTVVVSRPGGSTQSCTATVQGAAWSCAAGSIDTLVGGTYTLTATLTFGEDSATDEESFCGTGTLPYSPAGAACISNVGCADGTREGFVDETEYPVIASCGGAWDVMGMFHDEPACDRQAGNTGVNKQGQGCNVEDLCAPGWHVCHGPDDVDNRTAGRGCVDAVAADYPSNGSLTPTQTVPPGAAIFVGRTSGPGNGTCDNVVNGLPSTFNDIFGCGNFGAPTGANCSPLNVFGNDQCLSLQGPTAESWGYEDPTEIAWSCNDGADGTNESKFVTKRRPDDQGGVMCCKDSDPTLPELCDGTDNDEDGQVDETDFDNDGAEDDNPGELCTIDEGPGRITCTTAGGWACTPIAPEVCEDTLDNDLNGYVDVYDLQCAAPEPTCTVPVTPAAFSIRKAMDTAQTYEDLNWVATGDVDGDGRTEIVAANQGSGTIHVLDGETLEVESEIGINGERGDGIVIANLDADPELEVITVTHWTIPNGLANLVFIADWNGSAWVVSRSTTTTFSCAGNVGSGIGLGVADFDGDGQPEIFYGNEVWTYPDDLSTACEGCIEKVLDGDDASAASMHGCVMGASGSGPQGMISVVADVLDRTDCAGDVECDGPELIVAGQVFSLDAGGETMTLRVDVNDFEDTRTFGDGFTAVADLDNDGDLDVAVAGNVTSGGTYVANLYAYDPKHQVIVQVWDLPGRLVGAFQGTGHGYSPITIADVFDEDLADDGDTSNGSAVNVPELISTRVASTTTGNLTAVNVTSATPIWSLTTTDRSGSTATTVFDFNGDGILEMAYRDESEMRVMYGGPIVHRPEGVDETTRDYTAFECASATMNEGPTVADVDDDGAAELIVLCGSAGTSTARITVFESDSAPWREARRVWNQPMFDPGAIDEWGRVYPVAQARNSYIPEGTTRRPLNVNIAQSSPLDYLASDPNRVPAIDAVLESVSFGNRTSCLLEDDSFFTLEFTIRNDGDAVIPDSLPLSLYMAPPDTVSQQLGFLLSDADVVMGAMPIAKGASTTFRIDILMAATPTIWLTLNDTGDGPSLGECDLGDNASDAVDCEVEQCNPDSPVVPHEGCDDPTPYCTLPMGEQIPVCVPCLDDTAGGIDSGCNVEVPSCNPFLNECGPCADDPTCQAQGECPGSEPPALQFQVDAQCLVIDEFPIGELDPVVEWQRSSFTDFAAYDQVMMQPVVGNLTDDNEDGAIDENDIPDIVFTTFNGALSNGYTFAGVLRIISGDGGGELLATNGTDELAFPHSSSGVALGDLDGNGRPEIVVGLASASAATVGVWEANVPGQSPAFVFKWKSNACGVSSYPYTHPAIANVDGQGDAEIIMPGVCVLSSTGALVAKSAATNLARHTPFAANMDEDPELEIIDGVSIYDLPTTGTTLTLTHNPAAGAGYYFGAVGDMDGDGRPELVYVSPVEGGSTINMFDPDGATDGDSNDGWTKPIEGGTGDARGGPPTIADFDGDGAPEVGVAGETSYTVHEADGSVLWARSVQDASSSVTGSAVFDFDGDGAAEVVYADELNFYIYDGTTGEVRAQITEHASGTLFEYPIVVDVDRDGQVEIVLASNNYGSQGAWTGITVLGSETNSWTPARPVWNQHAYSISNVNDDLSIPTAPVPNWTRWNNFRAGAPLTGLPNWKTDLFLAGWDFCDGGCEDGLPYGTLSLIVGNDGLLDADNATVFVYSEDSDYYAWDFTAVPSGGSGTAQIQLPAGFEFPLGVYVFDGNDNECDYTNNQGRLEHAPLFENLDDDEFPDVCDACVAGVNPEICDGIDNDCDGGFDEDCDKDEDGFCDALIECHPEGVGEVCPNGCGDCDDGDGLQFPGGIEICNAEDDDCNGDADDGIAFIPITCGVGACTAAGVTACQGGQLVDLCTPRLPAANDALCNGVDDDCAGGVDEDYVERPIACDQCRVAEMTSCQGGREIIPPCLPRQDGLICQSNACALAAECQAGECVPTRIRACDDGNDCTSDSCDPEVGCVATAVSDGTNCSDRDGCTVGDTCVDGVCAGGEPVSCAAPAECELPGSCNPATGVCDYEFIEGCIACGADTTAPTLVCPAAPQVAECTVGGNAVTLGAPSARDECSAVSIATDAPNLYPGGTTIVTYTATDASGNSTSCSVPVTIEDSEPPQIFCQEVTEVEGDPGTCGALVTVRPTVLDDCDGEEVTLVGYGVEEAFFPPGPTEITITAIDAAGNQTTCDTVIDVVGLDDFSITCEAEVTKVAPADFCGWPEALTADVVDQCASIVEVTSETEAFPIGVTDVVFDAERDDGAQASCTTKLTVLDETDPVIACGHPPIPVDLAATFVPVVYDACTAEVTISGARCERETNGTSEEVVQRCDVTIEGNSAVVVNDAPPSNDGQVYVVWTVTATDPSDNTVTVECRAPVDPESLDHDKDGVLDRDDNCIEDPNTDQSDIDLDGIGDACDETVFEGLEALGGAGCEGGSGLMGLWLAALALVMLRLARRRSTS